MKKVDYNAINKLYKRTIRTPGYRFIQETLNDLYEESCQIQESGAEMKPGAYVFTAPSRFGKSTIIDDFIESHERHSEEHRLGTQKKVPIGKVRVRTSCTLKEYMTDCCLEVGITPGSSSTRSQMTRKLLDGIRNSGMKMFISDETNIVHESKGQKEIVDIRNFIKELIDESGIPIVFFGLPSCISFFRSDKQTHGRVEEYYTIPPFVAPTDEKNTVVFSSLKYMQYLKEDCNMTIDLDESQLHFSQRIYLASGGRIGGMEKLFLDVARYSYENGKSTITRRDFAKSLKKRPIAFELPCSDNPFLLSAKDLSSLMKKYPFPPEEI